VQLYRYFVSQYSQFSAIILCVASQQVFIVAVVYFIIDSVRKLLDTPLYSWDPNHIPSRYNSVASPPR